MAAGESPNANYDMNRVVEIMKNNFATKLADVEHQSAMLQAALEEAVKTRDEALEENHRLRSESVKPPGD